MRISFVGSITTLTAMIIASSAVTVPGLVGEHGNTGLGGLLGLPFNIPALTRATYPLFFPLSEKVGSIVSPQLKALLGDRLLEDLDKLADFACIATGNDSSGGICQAFLERVDKLLREKTPFGCYDDLKKALQLVCIAKNTQPPVGTCQAAFELLDCVANRILGVKDKECDGKAEPDR